MMCAWKELLCVLPISLRPEVDRLGAESLQELRLRIHTPPELKLARERKLLSAPVRQEDLDFVINAASRYSPWNAETIRQGYLTAPGGHRIGVCGEVICQNEQPIGIRNVRSVCIRVARDFPGIAKPLGMLQGNILILGPPGSGKTTLLRDLIRQLSRHQFLGVVDTRSELFPEGLGKTVTADVLTGCPKTAGMEMLLKTMGPETIAVDEITSTEDCEGVMNVYHCGVRLLATAHAGSIEEFNRRKGYQILHRSGVFDNVVLLNRQKTVTVERVAVCP